MISRRVVFVGLTIGTAAVVALIGACNDVNAPRRQLSQASPIARSWDAPDAPSASFTVDRLYGGYSDSTTLIARFPEKTFVYVIGTGFSVRHDVSGMNQADQTFNANSVSLTVLNANGTTRTITFGDNGKQVSDTISPAFTLMDAGSTLWKVYRPSWNASNLTITNLFWNGHWINCSPTTTPCYTFEGGQTISVVAPHASYTAHADSQSYGVGSTATIHMPVSPSRISGNVTPVQVDSALWTAAPDSLGGDAADTIPLNACGNYRWDAQVTDYLCDHTVKGAGTLTLIGHANGYRMAPQVPIAVSGPTLTLTAKPNAIAAGDSVTFTPKWSDGYAITVATNGWKWKPDTLPNLISQDGGDCTSSQTTCRKPIRQNGWMYVTVLRNGKQRTAKAQVTVSPCPNPDGDKILDEPIVRSKFVSMLDSTHTDLPPGDGIVEPDSVGTRREQGAWIFKRSDGSVYVVDDPPDPFTRSTECSFTSAVKDSTDLKNLKENSKDSLVGHAHTHTGKTGQELFGCGVRNGVEFWRGPWDTLSTRHKGYAPVTSNNGGGSDADWHHADVWHANEYVIKPGGLMTDFDIPPGDGPQVYTLKPNINPDQRFTNVTRVVIKGNRNAACDWHSN